MSEERKPPRPARRSGSGDKEKGRRARPAPRATTDAGQPGPVPEEAADGRRQQPDVAAKPPAGTAGEQPSGARKRRRAGGKGQPGAAADKLGSPTTQPGPSVPVPQPVPIPEPVPVPSVTGETLAGVQPAGGAGEERAGEERAAAVPAEVPAGASRPAGSSATVDAGPVRRTPPEAPPQEGEAAGRSLYEVLWASGLLNVGVIARRELGAFFVSPIGYVVAVVVVLPVSFLGYLGNLTNNLPVSMASIFSLIALLMVFFTPLYTMRLLSEERRSGTLEVLLTSPVRDWEVVVGKWLAGFLFYLATIAFTLVYVVLISIYQPTHTTASLLGVHLQIPSVDYGGIFAGYVGVALVGAAWVALGLLASSLTSNQIIAAVVGVGLLLAFQYLFSTLAGFLLAPYSEFFGYLNAASHSQSFSAGRLVLKDVLYFLTLTAGTLFVTARVVESRKWR